MHSTVRILLKATNLNSLLKKMRSTKIIKAPAILQSLKMKKQ